jgi:hypothetical protein
MYNCHCVDVSYLPELLPTCLVKLALPCKVLAVKELFITRCPYFKLLA